MKKNILLVFGTRPEAIKMAPLFHALKDKSDKFQTITCVTSQHRQMLDQVLEIFQIKPDIDLNLMKSNQSLSDLTSIILSKMQLVINQNKPDLILVHGDTTTTFATALAGFYTSKPIAHVEAGLRTNNLKAPFPEEFNRQVTSKLSLLHFAPTEESKKNLLSEGIDPLRISVTGNTVIDALFWLLKKIDNDINLKNKIESIISHNLPFNWKSKRYVMITAHRRENFGNGFLQIFSAIKKLALQDLNTNFVYPVHPNPNVSNQAYEILKGHKNIHLIQPQEYDVFIYLLKYSYLVLTDSGGIQEEAPSLGKPVLVMREATERPEGVLAGTVKLVGSNEKNIFENVSDLLNNEKIYKEMSLAHNPYGDGLACKRIIDFLSKF
jgi:UDP-N-acetylglucosamine 2-epimerase (non-hydrolysing)